jgi:hypothetical protein
MEGRKERKKKRETNEIEPIYFISKEKKKLKYLKRMLTSAQGQWLNI